MIKGFVCGDSVFIVSVRVLTSTVFCRAGVMIPTLETQAMLIGGVRYDELPIVHIKASLNNTIITVTDYLGQ